ncbi:Ger(x)C family spore germination protein [Paenibacillus turpanensis]|uniref:Ger(x)C family spore germination protein n=1 Tax=Paenibacillus turpanensis TaxID=2689078 RepID=UPI00140B4446|nr:Ger(x)C family spore germination protein [Paenibacillus turpanensis]
MYRRYLWAGLSLLLLLSLGACGYKDIDKRFFVVSIGIDSTDHKEKKYKVHLKLAIPASEVKAGSGKSILMTEDSHSITEAVRVIKSKVDKELDFSHAKVIIIGQKAASKNMKQMIDWFVRRRDIQKIAWVGIGKPDAESVLKLNPESERIPSNTLFLIFGESGTETSYVVSEYLFDFRKRLYERGLDPILPLIEVSQPKHFTINQAVVFNKEKSKLVLEKQNTKLFNILSNRIAKADFRISDQGKTFFVSTSNASASYRFQLDPSGAPMLLVKLQLKANIEEAHDPISNQKLSQYEQAAEKQLAKEVKAFLEKLQKQNLDPLGFGLMYRSQSFSSRDWEQWKEIYPSLTFEVQVDYNIQSTGGIR